MKTLVFIGLALILVITLAGAACAPKAPATSTGELVPKEQLTKAQADLTAEQQKSTALDKQVKDLQAQLAAAQKPAKVYRWQPATWIGAGIAYDQIVYWGNYLEEMTNGQIQVEPSQPGAICPVDEQIEAVSTGTTGAMVATPAYYAEKIPTAFAVYMAIFPRNVMELIDFDETYQEGAAVNLFYSEAEKLYNIKCANSLYHPSEAPLVSTVPIRSIADLEGKKIRTGDEVVAEPLKKYGASPVFIPGPDVYTSLATKVIDGFGWGFTSDLVGMGFQDIAKYWIKTPSTVGPNSEIVVINRDVWNELSDNLKRHVIVAADAASLRNSAACERLFAEAWVTVAAAGCEIINWPEKDQALYAAAQLEWAENFVKKHTEPANQEFLDLIKAWAKSKGYL